MTTLKSEFGIVDIIFCNEGSMFIDFENQKALDDYIRPVDTPWDGPQSRIPKQYKTWQVPNPREPKLFHGLDTVRLGLRFVGNDQ